MKVLKLVISADESANVVQAIAEHYLRENGFTSQHEAHLVLANKSDRDYLLSETNKVLEELMQCGNGWCPYPTEVLRAVTDLYKVISDALEQALGGKNEYSYTIHRFVMLNISGMLEIELTATLKN